MEYESVTAELDKLIEHQNQLALIVNMNELSETIQLTFATLQTKHQNIMTITLLKKLDAYINQLEQNFKGFKLPTLTNPSDIFHISRTIQTN